jgi:2-polyprenyl-3-methyl-5-hydroxy-6-metoxy-1,4-benzoquinol methylase
MNQPLENTTCLMCGSDQLNDLEQFSHAFLTKCQRCSFIFSKRIPSETELNEYYSSNYDVTRYFSSITEKRYNELLDQFEAQRKTNKILDIGAGYGFFLEVAKKRGWEVYGSEITDEAIEHCEKKGITMFKGPVSDIDFEKESFDIVVCIEVLEHLNTPLKFTKKVSELLRTDGYLYLTTPNFNSVLRYRLKEQYNVIEYPNHLCYYTPQTLNKLFTSNGFNKK